MFTRKMSSSLESFVEHLTLPESDSWRMSAEMTLSSSSKTLFTLPEHPPQVIPAILMFSMCSDIFPPHVIGLHQRKVSELLTTLTLESDIAAAANAGGNNQPVKGNNNPIARGIPIKL